MLRTLTTTAIAVAGVALIVGCGESKSPTTPTTPVATAPTPPATTPPPVVPPPPAQPTADDGSGTAKDTAATDPKGTLTKSEESKAMPEAGHGNNHSSPSLETNSKDAAPKN